MKLQIDTTSKVIKLEGLTNLSELFETLERFFPNSEWKEFKLETNTIINWERPIVVEKRSPYWLQPWYTNQPIVTCKTDNSLSNKVTYDDLLYAQGNNDLRQGVYNIEV
ncbi:MAG: hypothetical protein KDH96_03060 [Candidatus Riesia sp.]|nr:hypothetical protein [Candidatus Riesia sp.]